MANGRVWRWMVGMMAMLALAPLGANARADAEAGALTLVRDGVPTSVIVTANEPGDVQRVAAEQLQYHLEKMSGAVVPIVEESELQATDAVLVLVGQSDRVKALGIDTTTFEPEAILLQTFENTLVLAGEDGGSRRAPFYSNNVRSGTLHAVYELLQNELGCRWVWPGTTGEVIPRRATVTVGDLDVQKTPQLFMRHFRSGMGQGIRDQGLTHYPRYLPVIDEHYEPMVDAERYWLKRMRLGRSDRPRYGHAFIHWLDRYHDEHPEIFALQEDGTRGLPNENYRVDFVKMCPSSDKLIELLLEEFKAARESNPNHRWLNACENDGGLGFCQCEDCLAVDVKLTDDIREQLRAQGWSDDDIEEQYAPHRDDGLPRSLSNRYFHFYNKLARRLAEIAPDAYVVTYAYSRYRYAPLNMTLEPNIIVGLIGFNNYPMTEAVHRREVENFMAWKRSGIEAMFFRPNSFFFAPAHGFPWDASVELADDLKMLIDSGMVATDFDILNGHWSTAAPTFYVTARLHWDTDRTPAELRREFMDAFGPAADEVEAYFDHWQRLFREAYNRPDLEQIARQADAYGGQIGERKALPLLFSDQDMQQGRTLLARARAAAEQAEDHELLQRIEVLELGQRHGELMREGARFTIEREYEKPTRYEDHWPNVVEAYRVREKLAALKAHNVFWLNYFEMRMHDMYGTRVYYDFYGRPLEPVMTPTRADWYFVPDPQGVGEAEGWFARRLTKDESLQPFEYPAYRHLFNSTWVHFGPVPGWERETGQRVTNGWYQTEFAIAEQDLRPDHVLYVPYIKGSAKIWINDTLIRELTPERGAGDEPITIDPSAVGIVPDQPFRLTIKVHSPGEPGGLIGPVYVARMLTH